MKKISTFFFSAVPCLLGIGLQLAASFYLMLLSALFVFLCKPATSHQSPMSDLMLLWMDMDFNTMIMVVFAIFCIAVFGIWYYKSCGGNFRPDVKKSFHPMQLAGIACLVPGTQFMSSILIGFLSMLFPSWLEAYEALMETAGLDENISVIMMVYSVCLAPISEELIFRGVTMRIARRAFPFWIANIIQAVLFGVFHMNMLQGCYAFALGLFLGYICEHGGTIYHVIFFHFLFNLWGTTASEWLSLADPALAGFLILFGTTVGLGAGLTLFNRGTKALAQKKQPLREY
uniref:CPBP family glutamic-type intramembrane protease n=1 Tax=Agathobacter sp. TaxID=2021311 RepID=UPI0040562B71